MATTYTNRKIYLHYTKTTTTNGETTVDEMTDPMTPVAYGDTINFYTTNHNYQLVSPTPTTFAENTYYTKEGTKYTLLTESGTNKWETAITNHKNIYQRVNTEEVDCPVCSGQGTIFYRNNNNKTYKCPRCNGEKKLIKATDVVVTGFSIFYTVKNGSGKRTVKYQVTPPGAVTSVLIPIEDVID